MIELGVAIPARARPRAATIITLQILKVTYFFRSRMA